MTNQTKPQTASNVSLNTKNDLIKGPEKLLIKSLSDLPPDSANSGCEVLAILGDVSYSMGTTYGPNKHRIDGLQDALTAIWEITDWGLVTTHAFCFHSMPYKIPFESDSPPLIGRPHGGTNFIHALQEALDIPDLNRIILASDGEAPEPAAQIQICIERNIPVDTIFIGNDDSDVGAQLLMKISEMTGGIFTLCRDAGELVKQFQQLETHNRLLLTHSGGELPGPDVIKL